MTKQEIIYRDKNDICKIDITGKDIFEVWEDLKAILLFAGYNKDNIDWLFINEE